MYKHEMNGLSKAAPCMFQKYNLAKLGAKLLLAVPLPLAHLKFFNTIRISVNLSSSCYRNIKMNKTYDYKM